MASTHAEIVYAERKRLVKDILSQSLVLATQHNTRTAFGSLSVELLAQIPRNLIIIPLGPGREVEAFRVETDSLCISLTWSHAMLICSYVHRSGKSLFSRLNCGHTSISAPTFAASAERFRLFGPKVRQAVNSCQFRQFLQALSTMTRCHDARELRY
jgi:hypothetical protein